MDLVFYRHFSHGTFPSSLGHEAASKRHWVPGSRAALQPHTPSESFWASTSSSATAVTWGSWANKACLLQASFTPDRALRAVTLCTGGGLVQRTGRDNRPCFHLSQSSALLFVSVHKCLAFSSPSSNRVSPDRRTAAPSSLASPSPVLRPSEATGQGLNLPATPSLSLLLCSLPACSIRWPEMRHFSSARLSQLPGGKRSIFIWGWGDPTKPPPAGREVPRREQPLG